MRLTLFRTAHLCMDSTISSEPLQKTALSCYDCQAAITQSASSRPYLCRIPGPQHGHHETKPPTTNFFRSSHLQTTAAASANTAVMERTTTQRRGSVRHFWPCIPMERFLIPLSTATHLSLRLVLSGVISNSLGCCEHKKWSMKSESCSYF